MSRTMVYLMGAGPGDPELITQKAIRVIQMADVVLYDYLVHPNILMQAKTKDLICVGKKKGRHSIQQEDINQLLIKYAKAGKVVARLKGGDPMIFGRCGEEMTALTKEAIPYEIIPGITSAISVPTYAGIPITHRDHSHSVAFVTATRANDIENIEFPNADTLVLMMSLLRLTGIVSRLKELRDPDTPMAIIESGTYASEKVVVGTINTIESLQETHDLSPPALIVVGDVVSLTHQFNWRNHLPLRKHRFVMFRATHQQSKLRDQLSLAGAEVVTLPLNEIQVQMSALTSVDLTKITHVIFTSENGVRGFFDSLLADNKDARTLSDKHITVIGQHTYSALKALGIMADHQPDIPTSDGIFSELSKQLSQTDHVLIPTSSEADDTLLNLNKTGAKVTQVSMYINSPPENIEERLSWLKPDDHLIFMNAASVKRFCQASQNIHEYQIISIGPMTTKALTTHGATQILESDTPTIDGLVSKIIETIKP